MTIEDTNGSPLPLPPFFYTRDHFQERSWKFIASLFKYWKFNVYVIISKTRVYWIYFATFSAFPGYLHYILLQKKRTILTTYAFLTKLILVVVSFKSSCVFPDPSKTEVYSKDEEKAFFLLFFFFNKNYTHRVSDHLLDDFHFG